MVLLNKDVLRAAQDEHHLTDNPVSGRRGDTVQIGMAGSSTVPTLHRHGQTQCGIARRDLADRSEGLADRSDGV